ncbi:MAG: phosphoribosylformylglycinamidine synthase [SAR324 cluster bacterium]|nr:phosphoribosylformylglycinamidine synthase [SAR324 cluster bacterium]
MTHRIELLIHSSLTDPKGIKTKKQIQTDLGYAVETIRTLSAYKFDHAQLEPEKVSQLCETVLKDPVLHESRVNEYFGDEIPFDWYIEIGFRPGVTDNEGRTAQEALELWLQQPLPEGHHVHSSCGYFVTGRLTREQVERITYELLMNNLIEQAFIFSKQEWAQEKHRLMALPVVDLKTPIRVERFTFSKIDEIMKLSRERTLALSEEEAQAILGHFNRPEVREERQRLGIGTELTDVELEIIAQTWSEHCKHKIFNAEVHYTDTTSGKTETIHSLYKSCVKGSTNAIREQMGDADWCVSVFSDNAGVIKFNENWNLVMKVETHNSPSALDPYGGALTGIVGVNRDTFGTGLGAELIFNTDVFCFASPVYDKEIPPKLMHPRRIFEGVRHGVEHGGNKSGIPTVNGSIVFDERFLGKPLVFCGTGGLMPTTLKGKPAHKKEALPGDAIVMVGGRIGKDGIHGATFSSEALNEASPATAVQIGDPIVQKRMFDFLLEARNLGLYRCITDNGAGGLSSSVGEMAQSSNGARIELDKAPLKYPGLQPWEIFISEAQERMTLAVPQELIQTFLELSRSMDVESTVLGTFNDSGFLTATYHNELVACMAMEFLHDGLPPMKLPAVWTPPSLTEPQFEQPENLTEVLHNLLGHLNICSKESVIRQYDHEVQGGSVIKPLIGVANDGPADAAVIRPLLDSMEGVAVANGICPRYSDIDAYHMMTCAIDEAVRNIIAVGGSLKQIAGLDNFCWCDPVVSEHNPDGAYKMAQLVRANKALYDLTTLYGVPCISGKDSMKNDYRHGSLKISIPPTMLFTTIGKIEDVRKTITSDAKSAGDLVYVLGATRDELGSSEYYEHLGLQGANVPKVDGNSAKSLYQSHADAVAQQLIRSSHDCSDGGIAVALVETAFSGGLGMKLDLTPALAASKLRPDKFLFSETPSRFVVTISPEHQTAFEKVFEPHPCVLLGQVTQSPEFIIRSGKDLLIKDTVMNFKTSWQAPLKHL